jgi:hypothetical protein
LGGGLGESAVVAEPMASSISDVICLPASS